VELATAVLFLGMAWAGPLSDGWCLPRRDLSSTQFWHVMAYEAVLVSALLVLALVEHDGQAAPVRLGLMLLVAGLAAGAVWPYLHPVSPFFVRLEDFAELSAGTIGFFDGICGGLVGMVLSCIASPATGEGPSGAAGRRTAHLSLALVGTYLGWQATVGIASVAAVLFMFTVMFRNGWRPLCGVGFTGCLLLTTCAWIADWRGIVEHVPRLGILADHWTQAVGGSVVLAASIVTWLFRWREPMALPADVEERSANLPVTSDSRDS
jgi:hypothetical protein